MILLICLGNTSLTFSLYEQRKSLYSFKTYTDKLKSESEYMNTLSQFFAYHNIQSKDIEGCLLSSVVPSLTKRIQKAVEKSTNKDCMVLNKSLKTSFAIRTDNPSEVGSDLLALSIGAINTYEEDCLIIHLSSVLSFTIASSKREFLGTTFFPGMRESVSAMCSNHAQLMDIDLERPSKIVGKNTKDSINSGVMNGYRLLIRAMADEIEKEYKKPLKRIVTGSDALILKDILGHGYTYDSDLMFDGLYDIYMKNKGEH